MISKDKFKIKVMAVVYALLNISGGCYAGPGRDDVPDTESASTKALGDAEKAISEDISAQEISAENGDATGFVGSCIGKSDGKTCSSKVGLRRSITHEDLYLADTEGEDDDDDYDDVKFNEIVLDESSRFVPSKVLDEDDDDDVIFNSGVLLDFRGQLEKFGVQRKSVGEGLFCGTAHIQSEPQKTCQDTSGDTMETEDGSETEYDEVMSDVDPYEDLRNGLTAVNKMLSENPGCQRLFGTYAVVGDIHGDFDTFHCLISALQEDLDVHKIDGVVFLGDFWDRKDGDAIIFEELIDFMARNNKDTPHKIVVLRGNHEMLICRNLPGGNYDKYCKDLPPDLRTQVDEFYKLLPFNAIINNDTYLVHGGLPYYPEIDVRDSANRLISRDARLYPQDEIRCDDGFRGLLYSSLWSDFDSDVKTKPITNLQRSCDKFEACRFGSSAIMEYAKAFHDCDPSLNITNYVFGHDHSKGPLSTVIFSERGKGCVGVSTVITAPYLSGSDLWGRNNGGAVVLVSPVLKVPKKYLAVSMSMAGSIRIDRLM